MTTDSSPATPFTDCVNVLQLIAGVDCCARMAMGSLPCPCSSSFGARTLGSSAVSRRSAWKSA